MTFSAPQLGLIPLEVVNYIPKTDQSADCQQYCEAQDGQQYAVKHAGDSPVFPHTPFDELFCYELAHLCGIAVPKYNLLRMKDGSLAFGSAWEGGVIDSGFLGLWNEVSNEQFSRMSKNRFIERLSSIYAFDLFVHNEDRHAGNFIVRPSGSLHSIIAFDFSRSWTNLSCPIDSEEKIMTPPVLPLYYVSPPHHPTFNGQPSNTKMLFEHIWHKLGGLDHAAFEGTLDRLGGLETPRIEAILHKVPDEWCSSTRKQAVLDWWGSDERNARVKKIKEDYQNGLV